MAVTVTKAIVPPSGSDTETLTSVAPVKGKTAPEPGELIVTSGARFPTYTVFFVVLAIFPSESIALADITYVPSSGGAHDPPNGEDVASAILHNLLPKCTCHSTLEIPPGIPSFALPGSDTSAVKEIASPDASESELAGAASVAVGR